MLYVPKKKALTFQIFNVVEYANKPTLTPKVFSNSLLQQLIIYSLERKHIPASQQEKRVVFFFDNRLRPLSIVSIATNNRLLYIVTNIAALGFCSHKHISYFSYYTKHACFVVLSLDLQACNSPLHVNLLTQWCSMLALYNKPTLTSMFHAGIDAPSLDIKNKWSQNNTGFVCKPISSQIFMVWEIAIHQN